MLGFLPWEDWLPPYDWNQGTLSGRCALARFIVYPIARGDGAPDWIRTSDLQLRRLPLYPSELRARGPRSLQENPATR